MKTKAWLMGLTLVGMSSVWAVAEADVPPAAAEERAPRRGEWVQQMRRATEQAMEEMREALKAAQQRLAEAPRLLAQSVGAIRRERGRQMPVRPIRTLVVSPRVVEAKQMADMEEDLAVMSRLLAKDVEFELREEDQRPMNVVISAFGDQVRAPEAMYLEGFGAFFYLTVDFPLLPEAAAKADKPEAPPMDSDWDRARAELFGGAPEGPRWVAPRIGVGEPPPPPAYKAEKVEDLKRVLLSCLRNAVNIRGMKAEDWVQVSVCSFPRGAGGGEGGMAMSQVSVTTLQDGKAVTRSYGGGGGAGPRQGQLNLQIKRSDLQAYAEGKMTLEELRKKAQISVY
ncbi:MAG: hypothetical protein N3J91_00500 [Verrucomicrobiae bacterium]|nr:hypothetical protein [Verrucomicrobiae bacterium]